jgi:hypothetical protein
MVFNISCGLLMLRFIVIYVSLSWWWLKYSRSLELHLFYTYTFLRCTFHALRRIDSWQSLFIIPIDADWFTRDRGACLKGGQDSTGAISRRQAGFYPVIFDYPLNKWGGGHGPSKGGRYS